MLEAHHAASLRARDSRQTDWWCSSWPGSESEGGWQWRTVEEQQVIIAGLQEQVDMLTCAIEKILDEYRRQVRELSRRPAAEEVDVFRSEIGELKGLLSAAHDEKATQIDNITEAKQQIIDVLQQQVHELSRRPAFDGSAELRAEIDALKRTLSTAYSDKATQADELRAEIDMLTHMLSTAHDEKAIRTEIIAEDLQHIDVLQRQVNELSQRPVVDGADELRAEIDVLTRMLSIAHDEKAIQIEIITEEKQQHIDALQRQVNELRVEICRAELELRAQQRPAADEVDELRAEIDKLRALFSRLVTRRIAKTTRSTRRRTRSTSCRAR